MHARPALHVPFCEAQIPAVAPHPSAIAKKHISPLGQSPLVAHVTTAASAAASLPFVVVEFEQPTSTTKRKRIPNHDPQVGLREANFLVRTTP